MVSHADKIMLDKLNARTCATVWYSAVATLSAFPRDTKPFANVLTATLEIHLMKGEDAKPFSVEMITNVILMSFAITTNVT